MNGAIFSNIDVRDYKGICCSTNTEFPDEFELKMLRVKDQKNINSCVAHVLSSIIEYYNFNQQNITKEMSVGYIYGNRTISTYKEEGMIVRDALEVVRLYGDVYQKDFPYNKEVPTIIELYENDSEKLYNSGYVNRISTYYKLESPSSIKATLMNNIPVLIGIKWYKDIKVVDGILTSKFDKSDYTGGHCMLLYGWNQKGWKVQNSWGYSWGDNGCAIIPYDIKLIECWAITDDIINENDTDIYVKKPFSSKFGKWVAKYLNYILKYFIKIK